MTLTWLGGSGVNNWWQGIGDLDPTTLLPQKDMLELQNTKSPRSGDTYLSIDSGTLYTFDEKGDESGRHWFSIN